MMKLRQKSIAFIIILALGITGAFFYFKDSPSYKFYQDNKNKVSFEKPETWSASSVDGYVRVSENNKDPSKPSILVKLEYPEDIIPLLGLDKGGEVKIAGKMMHRSDKQIDIPANPNKPASTITYTELLWEAPDGRKIIFEISPWQKPDFDKDVEKFLETFTSSR